MVRGSQIRFQSTKNTFLFHGIPKRFLFIPSAGPKHFLYIPSAGPSSRAVVDIVYALGFFLSATGGDREAR
jgi:hypothetical protein